MATKAARGRPRSFDRDAALDTAIRLFWERGYEGTSTRDLSEALGVGAPSIYAAFGDKRTLFAEAVDVYGSRYGEFIDAALAEEPTAREALLRILREAPARYTRDGLPRGCLLVTGDGGASDEMVLADMSRRRARNTRVLADRIRADVDAGMLPADVDADALAGFVLGVLTGLVQAAGDGVDVEELNGVAAIAARAVPGPEA